MIDGFEPLVIGNRRLLFEFPESSDRADMEIRFADDLIVQFKYHDGGSDDAFWIRFDKTYAYQYYNQSVSNEFHVDHSIDQLVELTESQWLDDVRARARSAVPRHFLFFAEDHGALEVLAAAYETGGRPPLPPEYQPEEDDE